MYRSTEEVWAEERAQVAAKAKRKDDRRAKLEVVNDLPTVSQRVIGRALVWFGR